MRILIVSDLYWPKVDGASVFTQRLAQQMRKRGHDVRVMAPSRHFHRETYEHADTTVLGMPSVPVIIYRGLRLCFSFVAKRAVRETLAAWRPDVIHIQNHFYLAKLVLPIAERENIPIMGTNHFMPENLLHYFPGFMREWLRRLGWRQFRAVFDHLRVVTTPAHKSAELLAGIGFEKEVRVISNGVDLTYFKPASEQPGLRDKYRIPAGPILLYVGRMDREKNLDRVLRALPAAQAKAKFTFVIVGRGEEGERIRQLAQELKLGQGIVFAGYIPNEDLPAIYRVGSCFIMAGTAELQSLVTMEAMATGLPVIAADALALPELVHDGDNGFLFPPEDIAALSDRMVRIFSDEDSRQRMGRKSLEIIQEHDINKSMDKFEALYRSLVSHQE